MTLKTTIVFVVLVLIVFGIAAKLYPAKKWDDVEKRWK